MTFVFVRISGSNKGREEERRGEKSREHKTSQEKTRKTRQDKTRQDEARKDEARRHETRKDETRRGKARQGKARQGKTTTRKVKGRKYKTRGSNALKLGSRSYQNVGTNLSHYDVISQKQRVSPVTNVESSDVTADQGQCCFALRYWVGGFPVRQNSTNVTANNSKL